MHLPSSTSLLSTTLLLLLSSPTTTTALPTADKGSKSRASPKFNFKQVGNCSLTPPPSLPPSTLPAIGAGLQLKHIALGRGTQNYTCASPSSAPVAAGAVATLFDVSCLATDPKARDQLTTSVTPTILSMPQSQVGGFLASRAPCALAGAHFFRDGTTPVFVFNKGDFIASGKVAGCAAPAGATGNGNGPAIDWLKLARKTGEANGGVEEVYRVETAGGRAPASCGEGSPAVMTVDYVAEYWFYG